MLFRGTSFRQHKHTTQPAADHTEALPSWFKTYGIHYNPQGTTMGHYKIQLLCHSRIASQSRLLHIRLKAHHHLAFTYSNGRPSALPRGNRRLPLVTATAYSRPDTIKKPSDKSSSNQHNFFCHNILYKQQTLNDHEIRNRQEHP